MELTISFTVRVTDDEIQSGEVGIRAAAQRFCEDLEGALDRPYAGDGPIGDAILAAFADAAGIGPEMFFGWPAGARPTSTVDLNA